jgi:hypothetical protein
MEELTQEDRDFFNNLREKCCRQKKKGYIYYIYFNGKTKKSYKRSRILYQIYHNVKLSRFDIIHHKDENKENDNINNLELKNLEEHISGHHAGKRGRKNKNVLNN